MNPVIIPTFLCSGPVHYWTGSVRYWTTLASEKAVLTQQMALPGGGIVVDTTDEGLLFSFKMVLMAIFIASPLAYYTVNRWLSTFAYHIDLSGWVFALAGGIAVSIALLTVSVQSIRAALVNPVKSLRSE